MSPPWSPARSERCRRPCRPRPLPSSFLPPRKAEAMNRKTLITVALVAAPFFLANTAPQGCVDAKTALAQAKSDIDTAEQTLALGTSAFCAQLPMLQATADTILSVTAIDAKTAASVAAGK